MSTFTLFKLFFYRTRLQYPRADWLWNFPFTMAAFLQGQGRLGSTGRILFYARGTHSIFQHKIARAL